MHRVRQLRDLLRAGAVRRQVRPGLRDLWVLRSVPGLSGAGAHGPRYQGRRTTCVPPGRSSGRTSRTPITSTRSMSPCATAAASASKGAWLSATGRSFFRSVTTGARTATSAPSRRLVLRRRTSGCPPTSRICSKGWNAEVMTRWARITDFAMILLMPCLSALRGVAFSAAGVRERLQVPADEPSAGAIRPL